MRTRVVRARMSAPPEDPARGEIPTGAQGALGPTEGREEGAFTLHKFQQPIGREKYEILVHAGGISGHFDFGFTDRGEKVPLEATFRGERDLSPIRLTVEGKTCRQAEIHCEVDVGAKEVRIRDRESWRSLPRPERLFTAAGYAPVGLQMLLLRYWLDHGTPRSLPSFPTGRVEIAYRGSDPIRGPVGSETLDRYSIRGLIWGHETLWLDQARRLVALVTMDAEFDHFEAVREGYESSLEEFIRGAGADGMEAMRELGARFAGTAGEDLVIVHGTLIDGTGAPKIQDSTVVVRAGRISALGAHTRVAAPDGVPILDATGYSVLPGLWDMHAHFQQVEWGPIYLAAGVTTVRDCANELEFLTSVRDSIAGGRGLGPRILAAGVVDGSGPLAVGVARVDTAEDAERWVDRYARERFQQIKVYSSMSRDAVRWVADAAHRRDMTVTGHVPEGLTADQAIEAGQDQINHIWGVAGMMVEPPPAGAPPMARAVALAELDLDSERSRRAIEFLRTHRTVVDPTLALAELSSLSTAKPAASFEPGAAKVPEELAGPLRSAGPPSPQTELRERIFAKCIEIVRRLHANGIPIVAGTDQAVPGHSLHRELELYVSAGFTPLEALQSATVVPARVLGLEAESGTLAVGKRADLILVEGDPTERIRDIRRVRKVVAAGRLYDCAELWRSVGFQP